MAQDARAAVATPRVRLMELARGYRAYKHDLLAATERTLDVPLGAEPLTSAAVHFVESILAGTEPVTSGARSLRVVEALETADRTAVRSGKLA